MLQRCDKIACLFLKFFSSFQLGVPLTGRAIKAKSLRLFSFSIPNAKSLYYLPLLSFKHLPHFGGDYRGGNWGNTFLPLFGVNYLVFIYLTKGNSVTPLTN